MSIFVRSRHSPQISEVHSSRPCQKLILLSRSCNRASPTSVQKPHSSMKNSITASLRHSRERARSYCESLSRSYVANCDRSTSECCMHFSCRTRIRLKFQKLCKPRLAAIFSNLSSTYTRQLTREENYFASISFRSISMLAPSKSSLLSMFFLFTIAGQVLAVAACGGSKTSPNWGWSKLKSLSCFGGSGKFEPMRVVEPEPLSSIVHVSIRRGLMSIIGS